MQVKKIRHNKISHVKWQELVKEVEKGAPQFVPLWFFVQPNSETGEIF